jgi:hypothetical protein
MLSWMGTSQDLSRRSWNKPPISQVNEVALVSKGSPSVTVLAGEVILEFLKREAKDG